MATAANCAAYGQNCYTWNYGYDVMGRANQQTLAGLSMTAQASYTYDSDSNLTGVVYPGGNGVSLNGEGYL